ncbi:hypothetical protein GGI24_006746, partial [Coemansia furcata]
MASAVPAAVAAAVASVAANRASTPVASPPPPHAPTAPTVQEITRGNSVLKSSKYVAIFVEDVTIPDGTHMAPGESFVKIWSVANMGDTEWPRDTMLVHIEGEPTIPGNKKTVPIVVSKRYEQVGIAVDLVAPTKPGRYVSQWRLMTAEGQYFGTGLWCTIVVEEPSPPPVDASVPDVSAVVDVAISAADAATAVVASSADKGKAADVDSVIFEREVVSSHEVPVEVSREASQSKAASAASSSIFVDHGEAEVKDFVIDVPATTVEELVSANVDSGTSPMPVAAAAATTNESAASIESLSNTFVKISADLMSEIRRLDQSIRVLQLRQDMADAA